ncbi:DnaJ-like protein subfamily B member 13 [Entamoeba marina]
MDVFQITNSLITDDPARIKSKLLQFRGELIAFHTKDNILYPDSLLYEFDTLFKIFTNDPIAYCNELRTSIYTFGKKYCSLKVKAKVTLDSLYYGINKTIKIQRQTINKFTGEKSIITAFKTISIEPGTPNNHQVIFEKEGNEEYGYVQGDLIIVIETVKHPLFERENDDLILRKQVTNDLIQSGFMLEIPYFGSSVLKKQIQPFSIKPNEFGEMFSGKGMPRMNEPLTNGDLFILFELEQSL